MPTQKSSGTGGLVSIVSYSCPSLMILVCAQILVEQSVVDMYQESSCSQSVVGRLDQAARRMEQVQNMRTLYEEILESLTSSSEDDVQKWNFIEKLEIMPIASGS